MTTYKLLKDYPVVNGPKIHTIPSGTIIHCDMWEDITDRYISALTKCHPSIPKSVVENNPDYFERVEQKYRELLVSIDGNKIISCEWNDGTPIRTKLSAELAIFREVLK